MDAASVETEALLGAVRAGDEEAAHALVLRLHPLVMRLARSHRPLRMSEDDLVQGVFARLFERLGEYRARPGIPFEHWVSRLAVRVCFDALRAERRRPEVRWSDLSDGEAGWLDHLASEDAPSPADGASAEEARQLVDRLLAGLPPKDRCLIQWLDLEERSVAEVADLTGWSAVHVRVRAFRARRKLRRLALDQHREARS